MMSPAETLRFGSAQRPVTLRFGSAQRPETLRFGSAQRPETLQSLTRLANLNQMLCI